MKRYVWGIILFVFGFLSLFGAMEKHELGPSFVFLVPGVLLAYFGKKYLNEWKQTTEMALQMIRDDRQIDAFEISKRLGISEINIRLYLLEAKKKGIIPNEAEII